MGVEQRDASASNKLDIVAESDVTDYPLHYVNVQNSGETTLLLL